MILRPLETGRQLVVALQGSLNTNGPVPGLRMTDGTSSQSNELVIRSTGRGGVRTPTATLDESVAHKGSFMFLIVSALWIVLTALLLLYDVTSKTSFDNIRAWLAEIYEYAHDDVVIMLLGNKADIASERAVRSDDGERLAKEYDVVFMETSAKTGLNVDLAFTAIARKLKSLKTNGSSAGHDSFNVVEFVDRERQRSGCCS